jgi:hypothetical protein
MTLQWDFQHPCPHCGFVYLKTQLRAERTICCLQGHALDQSQCAITPLQPYPDELADLFLSNIGHFSKNSAVYNRMFSILSTYIDNGRHNGVERRNGSSAVTINGSVKYYFHGNVDACKGGLAYFLYDGLDKLMGHGKDMNQNQSTADGRIHGERVNVEFLRTIYTYLRQQHPYCSELIQIGKSVQQHDAAVTNAKSAESTCQLGAEIVNSEGFLEVATFTADNIRCNRQYKFKLRGQVQTLLAPALSLPAYCKELRDA